MPNLSTPATNIAPRRHFLAYWRPETVARQLADDPRLNHSASDQYGKVGPGDTIWIVTVRDGALLLAGRLLVARRTTFAGAARALGTSNLWEAKHHVLAHARTAEPMREVHLGKLSSQLTFVSRTRPRLVVAGRKVNPQQLQTMRLLSPDSATLLEQLWRSTAPVGKLKVLPSADPMEFEGQVAALMRRGRLGRPRGDRHPVRVPGAFQQAFARSPLVKAWVLQEAKGKCECCGDPAPFKTALGVPFLEVHHVTPLAEEGSDTPENAAAVCPNCHRALHHADDREFVVKKLFRKVRRLKPERRTSRVIGRRRRRRCPLRRGAAEVGQLGVEASGGHGKPAPVASAAPSGPCDVARRG